MLEIYVPIYSINSNKILGAFELYVDDSSLTKQLVYNYRVIIVSIILSLTILYLSLMGIIKKASATISSQSSEINQLCRNLEFSLDWQEKAQIGTIKALISTLNAKDNEAFKNKPVE